MIARRSKITIVFLIAVFAFIILLAVFFYRATIERNIIGRIATDYNTAIRGNIISKDQFTVAVSQKVYDIKIDTRSLDPNKIDLFVQLYTIYTGENPTKITKLINSKRGTITLSSDISARIAAHLKELTRNFVKYKIFIPFSDHKGRKFEAQAMSIIEKGEERKYMAKTSLTPIIGYVREKIQNDIIMREGVKGVEKYYENYLAPIKNAILRGSRDLNNNIIIDKPSDLDFKINGYDIILNISLKLQKMSEKLIDEANKEIGAKEIVVGVMDSKNGKILLLATTNRYDPQNIKKSDYKALNSTASEYAYEPGSVIKPIVFSYLLENEKVNPLERINTHGGIYKHGNSTIRDSKPADFLSAEDVIVYSSNIGMIELSKRIRAEDMYMNFIKFGFTRPTNIDLPYEQNGLIPTFKQLESEIYKGTVSYGYGMQATFLQLLCAYSAFNNNGFLLTPKIVSSLRKNNKHFEARNLPAPKQILSEHIAKRMQKILIKVVENGTAKKAGVNGLEIGGKTGTSRIAIAGGYSKDLYNASFYGFANDYFGRNYTIGVFVREPRKDKIYAAQSAIPIFRDIVLLLVEENYLKLDATKTQSNQPN